MTRDPAKEAALIASITTEEMESAIHDLAFEDGTEILLAIPGVWELVAEHYNNEAIERVLEARGDEDDEHSEECDECGEMIPESEPSMVNAHHAETCSLYGRRDDESEES